VASARYIRNFWLPLAMVVILIAGRAGSFGSALAQPATNHARDGTFTKVRVNDPAVGRELANQGAELIADYGSFNVYRVDKAQLNHLPKSKAGKLSAISDQIKLNAEVLDTTFAQTQTLRKPVRSDDGLRLHLIQFAGPVKPEWRQALERTGVQVVAYIPQNAFLIFGKGSTLVKMQAWAAASAFVQWEGPYLDSYKIHPRARATDNHGNPLKSETDLFAIQLLTNGPANAATLKLLDTLKLEPIRKQWRVMNYLNVIARLPPDAVARLAAQPEVISIQPYAERRKLDERQDQILAGNLTNNSPSGPGYLDWLASKGFSQTQFDASGFSVDISDSGIDNGTTAPGHFGMYAASDTNQASRVVYNRLIGTSNTDSTLQGCDGHGNLNAHIVGGYNNEATGFPHTDAAGFHYDLGVCPFVRIGSSVIFDPDFFTHPDYVSLQSQAYDSGARISNNSWGATASGAYDIDSQTYDALVRDAQPDGSDFPNDGNQEMVIVFSAGNSGPGMGTVGSPGTAKNVITVGAAESVQSLSDTNGGNNSAGNDGCLLGDAAADNANDMAAFTSRGPCTDGRLKPEIVAPGTHISGGAPQESPPPPDSGTGTALFCFSGSGICGLLGTNVFFPTNQQFYTVSSGTSHSAPAVAGICALLRQDFLNHGRNPPSPAMTKAYLMNSARYLNGAAANDSLWSNTQGMGEASLNTAFDGAPRLLRDELTTDKFTATGQTRTYTGYIADTNQPFRVTLAWTDAPGSTAGNAYNNDLDLTVTINGQTYKGNVFSGPFSTPGGTADFRNNAESVFLPAGVSGNFAVTVTAANINSDGVPNEAPDLDQDFALVVYNGTEASVPVIAPESASLSAESCAPTNSAVDPGETVSMDFSLVNAGLTDATNLVATLLSTNGITAPSGPQTYGILAAGSADVSRSFTFTATGSCGTTIHPTFRLQDGTNDLGLATFEVFLGEIATVLSENFDACSPPALPFGWMSSATGGQTSWTTFSTNSDTSPNAAFSPDAGSAGVNELVSPVMNLGLLDSQLTFRQSYDLESGFDGGVLEIKIGDGGFSDVLSAGCSFATGGYTTTLAGDGSNPLNGRQAWTGNSGGFITTVLNVPVSAAGQPVQFRWRCGSDNSVGYSGWYIDTIQITSVNCCGQVPPGTANFDASPTSGGPAPLIVTFNDTSTGSITNRYWDFGNSVTTNTTATNFTIAYNTVGTNTVTLTVSGDSGISMLTRTNYIVVTNPAPVIVSNGITLVSETCTNGAIDPGETVLLNFGLRNSGSLPTTNLVATLLAGGNVLSPTGPQNYGVMASGATAVRSFGFIAMGTCGGTINTVLQLQDGSTSFGTVSFPIILGQASPFAENFDGAIVPSLPSGWTSSATGAQSGWVTTTAAADTSPNSAFSPDPNDIGVNDLTTLDISVPAMPVQFTFKHRYDLEASISGITAFDGGVLEISIDNGDFQDVIAAGANFASGGYNKTISSTHNNPLAGRQAWSGNSGGFITTILNLPTAALGHSVRFRWRCGTDDSTAGNGWYLDTVSMGGFVCCTTPPTITTQPQNTAVFPGQTATFNVSASGSQPLAYQWRFGGSEIPGATNTSYSVMNAQPADGGGYDVVVTNLADAVTSSVATLTLLSPPSLVAPRIGSNGHFIFMLNGSAGYNYAIENSTNLSNWITLKTVTNQTGEVFISDTNLPLVPFRAYRARLVP
jgi:PKD repeat protein